MIIYFLESLVAICSLHCRHSCCNNVTLHLSRRLLLLLLPRSLFAEHLFRICDDLVVLFASDVLALVEVAVVALIFVKLNELLVGVMDPVSCRPYLVQGLVEHAALTLSWAIIVQGKCLHKHVPDEDKLAARWCPFAEALRRVSSFAFASLSIAVDGMLVVSDVVVVGLLVARVVISH
jgi:hypothetical protein